MVIREKRRGRDAHPGAGAPILFQQELCQISMGRFASVLPLREDGASGGGATRRFICEH
jgi:hypothetical protein